MKRKIITLIFLFAAILQSNGQQSAGDSVKNYFSGNIAFGGFYSRGNTNKFFLEGKEEIKFTRGITESSLSALITYGETDGLKDENDIYGTFTLDLYYDNIWSPFILQTTERSLGRSIDVRSQSGLGVKYTFIPFPKHKSSLSAAVLYDYSNYADVYGDAKVKTTRLSVRVKTKQVVLGGHLIFTHITFYQPNLKDFRNALWRSETSLDIPVADFLYLNSTYSFVHEDAKITGNKPDDHKLTFGLTVNY